MGGLTRRATAYGVGSIPLQTTSMSGERELAELMRPFTTGSDYVNQIALETDDGSERIKAAYGANYERLVAVKNEYDPTNLFRPNQNIKPDSVGGPRLRAAPKYATISFLVVGRFPQLVAQVLAAIRATDGDGV